MEKPRIEVDAAALHILRKWDRQPRIGIILGSGLGDFAKHIDAEADFHYGEIPHFANPTATGHRGRLVCGRVSGEFVIAMQGRFHLYEGCSVQRVTFPIRVMKRLGIEVLIVSNACGGLHPNFRLGDIVAIEDQINLTLRNPLPRCSGGEIDNPLPNMRQAYDRELIEVSLATARKLGFAMHRGIYAGVLGPNYETRAEIRMLRRLGADAVGMSTIPEVVVAVQERIRVVGLSVVTNECRPDAPWHTTGEGVIESAESTEPRIRDIVRGLVERVARGN